MRVLVVNTGSSSLKLRLLDPADQITATLDVDPWDGQTDTSDLAKFVAMLDSVDAVGHRVVHGGTRFHAATVIDDAVRAGIGALTDLAPLHQPRALAGIDVVRSLLPAIPQVACFDTAFHAGLPPAAATYALPAVWREHLHLRRYGFHGLSHRYAAGRAAALLHRQVTELRLVTCHLGAGASLAAVHDGASVDTTMGFTPLDGLVMATRAGSVDPGLVLWLLRRGGVGLAEVADKLEHASGLAGLAGLPGGSGDMRDVRLAADAGDPRAALALDVYIHRLRAQIASMTAAMNGLDVLVFTGGVGEHQPSVRADAAAGLSFLGVGIDPERNQTARADADITAAGYPVRTLVITAREDIEIAHQIRTLLA